MRIIKGNRISSTVIQQLIREKLKKTDFNGHKYWAFCQDNRILGFIVLGKEPLRLQASIGTPFTEVFLFEEKLGEYNTKILVHFVNNTVEFSKKLGASYSLVTTEVKHQKVIEALTLSKFEIFDHCFIMLCSTQEEYELVQGCGDVEFIEVEKDQATDAFEFALSLFQTSPDRLGHITIATIVENPAMFMDYWITHERWFFVSTDNQIVGIMGIRPTECRGTLLGIRPEFRGKKLALCCQIFSLRELRKAGCEVKHLRVHRQNYRAISIFKQMGYQIKNELVTFKWINN